MPNMRQVAFTRFMLVVAVLLLWFGGVSARLVYLQIHQHSWLKEQAMRKRMDIKKSKMLRGSIFDRNNRILAMSIKVKTLYADATAIENVPAAAKSIAVVLGLKQNQLESQLQEAKNDERKFVPLARDLDDETFQRINNALEDPKLKKPDLPRFAGLHWRDEQKRSYPQQTLAAHVVGFSNAEGLGQAGIEQSQNEVLYGAVIKKIQERDRLGRVYDETVSEQEPPHDVVLTIDNVIQYKTDEALAKAVIASGAKSGTAIVVDHRTGEVLALSNYPTFDPNALGSITPDNLTNRAVQSVYAPGSVFKLVTYGAALERKLITPDAMIDSGNGTIEIAKHKFTDSHAIGSVTAAKALAHSSNVCAIKTSMRVGKENFYGTVKKLGFGKSTGIELPAETSGIVRHPDKWNGDSLASMAIGYEIGVSALQMATAFATIANDGVRVQPHIIKEIRQSDEKVISVAKPEKTRVLTSETARDLRTMLRQVVLDGTGKRAQLSGYTSAGKTGTAWKYDPVLKRVNPAKYMSSFIGFAPAENPAVTIAVIMDEPKIGGRDGGQVAAPVFREIADQILPELKVSRDSQFEAPLDNAEDVPENIGNVESLVAETIETPVAPIIEEKAPLKINPERTETRKEEPKKNDNVQKKNTLKPEMTVEAKPEKRTEPKQRPALSAPPDARPRVVELRKSSTEKAKNKT